MFIDLWNMCFWPFAISIPLSNITKLKLDVNLDIDKEDDENRRIT